MRFTGVISSYERAPRVELIDSSQITIFKTAICTSCRTEQEVVAMVRKTVIHEVAHHFGIDDENLKVWGWG
jgi:predicted Zn-dependent protease with MMP-like domain